MAPHFDIERGLLAEGKRFVAGADEAGRGSLAGPLAVGLVVYPPKIILSPPSELIEVVRDSKMLSPRQRHAARDIIQTYALYCDVCLLSHRYVDMLNINGATCRALQKLVARFGTCLDAVIFGGNFSFDIGCEFVSVIKGDLISFSVASASIIAKVRRDGVMEKLESFYPGYGFARHKGYGTAAHREKIKEFGPCPIHRRSYEPVKSMFR